eukprot:scaffold205260_cov18-Tisochrysis_lutea.AAC.1
MATTPQAGPIQMQPLERVGAALGVQGSSLPLEQQQLRPEFGGIGGSAAQQAAAQQQQLQPGAGGIGGADHPAACPPRMPLARSGKQIRGTADLLLANVGSLSKVSWVEGKRGFRGCSVRLSEMKNARKCIEIAQSVLYTRWLRMGSTLAVSKLTGALHDAPYMLSDCFTLRTILQSKPRILLQMELSSLRPLKALAASIFAASSGFSTSL